MNDELYEKKNVFFKLTSINNEFKRANVDKNNAKVAYIHLYEYN